MKINKEKHTLKELMFHFGSRSDEDVVIDWIFENGVEENIIQFINKIHKKKYQELEDKYVELYNNIYMYSGSTSVIERYGRKIGSHLDRLTYLFILGKDIENELPEEFEWLKQTIPTLKEPRLFWNPFYEWLKSKNINFMKREGRKNG